VRSGASSAEKLAVSRLPSQVGNASVACGPEAGCGIATGARADSMRVTVSTGAPGRDTSTVNR
jgi:hypothetical protein